MPVRATTCAILALTTTSAFAEPAKPQMIQQFTPDPKLVERGRYIAIITGCHDCHTPGYAIADGKASEDQWLIGDQLRWRGPWGTTYPANLRLVVQPMRERDWLDYAKKLKTRPPMPWFSLNALNEEDSRALFHFIKSLPSQVQPVPDALPPDKEPPQPYVQFPAPPK
jgi:mono/diheme cytochrome c family protein